MKRRILIVDDEELTRRSLADILKLEGYEVTTAADGESALTHLRGGIFEVMLLDLKMPGINGVEVMRIAAEISPDTKIIMLTAHGSVDSAIEAIHLRAHDYIRKPASSQKIIESIEKALPKRISERHPTWQLNPEAQGRVHEQSLSFSEIPPKVIKIGTDILVDLTRRMITHGESRIMLTPAENRLLKIFVEHPGEVFSHRDLVLMAQGYDTKEWEAPEVLRPLVSRLRRKLQAIPGAEHWIINVRGTGYMFEVRGKN